MRLNNTGLGIGTTSPGEKLSIGDTGNVGMSITDGTHTQYVASIATANAYGNGSTVGQLYLRGYDGIGFSGNQGGATHMTLLTGGNVGIGTTSPGYTLQVGSTSVNSSAAIIGNSTAGIEVRTNSAGGRIAALEQYFGNEGSLWLYLSNTVKILLRADGNSYFNGGNVGIGTSAPSSLLTVAGTTDLAWTASTSKLQISRSGAVARLQNYENGSASTNLALQWEGGNVGIGTTSPGVKLDIDGGSSGASVRVKGDQPAGTYYYGFMYDGTNLKGTTQTNIFYSGSTIAANTTIAEYAGLRIDAPIVSATGAVVTNNYGIYQSGSVQKNYFAGNVGIGTTNPGAKLDVNGEVYVSPNTAGKNTFVLTTNASNDGRLLIKSDTTTKVDIQANGTTYFNGGNVGIGTTNPLSPLHQVGGGAAYTGEARFGGSSTAFGIELKYSQAGATSGSIYVSPTYNSADVLFKLGAGLGNTNQLVLQGNGNVGIGTTAPVSKLQVASASNAVDVLRIGNTAGDSGSVQGVTHLAINHFNGGTNPSTRITAYQDGVSGWPGGMYFSTRSLNTDSAPVERMRITSAGNVGIGTTAPTHKLHVASDVRIDAADSAPQVNYFESSLNYVYGEEGAQEIILGKPDVWLRINVDGMDYVFPGYNATA